MRASAPSTGRPPTQASTTPTAAGDPRGLVNKYCVTCHNARSKAGGLLLDTVDAQRPADDGMVWEKVVRKLHAGTMPPAGAPRPDRAVLSGLTTWLETELDRAAAAHVNPGRTAAFHRLNRTEYQNAVRDLLDLDAIDISAMLPADDMSYGFDNIGGVLKLSSSLLERYLSAARKISRLVVNDPHIPFDSRKYFVREDLSQYEYQDGLPLGSRGGVRIRHYFPVDGEYLVKVAVLGSSRVPTFEKLEILVDGALVNLVEDVGAPRGRGAAAPPADADCMGVNGGFVPCWSVKLPFKAGPRDLDVTFAQQTEAELDGVLALYPRPHEFHLFAPAVKFVLVEGPYEPAAAAGSGREPRAGSDAKSAKDAPPATATRHKVFSCRPASAGTKGGRSGGPGAAGDPGNGEAACARRILSSLARQAYRRPVVASDIDELLPFYQAGRAEGGFEIGVQRAIERLLVSPSFLFRVEEQPPSLPAETAYRVGDLDLASRLSFFLWSTIPDEELIAVAASGRLSGPAELQRQVTRMLASPKAEALVTNFAGQWLQLRNLDTIERDRAMFPYFDDALRKGLRQETEHLFASILREGRSAVDLLNADYTFVNERLARHYGIPNVYGTQFRRVAVPDEARRGLLGQGSVLTLTSYPTRTSPVIRGKWILERLLNAPPPAPPPNVPVLAEKDAKGERLPMRRAMESHRANPACSGCHAQMDPLGFALENFDAIGRWRTRTEAFEPIDASGALPSGATFEGVNGLRKVLVSQSDRFVATLTERLLTYGVGRGLEYYDMPAVRHIVREAAREDYRLSTLVVGVVRSAPFQMRRAE
jgi:mono/diheme cytochrome c family protein